MLSTHSENRIHYLRAPQVQDLNSIRVNIHNNKQLVIRLIVNNASEWLSEESDLSYYFFLIIISIAVELFFTKGLDDIDKILYTNGKCIKRKLLN